MNTQSDDRLERETRVTSNTFLLITFVFNTFIYLVRIYEKTLHLSLHCRLEYKYGLLEVINFHLLFLNFFGEYSLYGNLVSPDYSAVMNFL